MSHKKLKELKVANSSLYDLTAIRTQTSPTQVKEIIEFVGEFTANVIKQGAFESVMIPYFGKFKPKVKKIQWINHNKTLTKL
jgi:nucleoid DNA-binding protein